MSGERTSPRSLVPQAMFACLALGVYAACLAVAHALPHLRRPGAAAAGLTIDLAVVVPLAFYLLVVRRRGWPIATLVPLVIAGVAVAARILPPEHRRPAGIAELLIVPLELGVVGWIAWRAARSLRTARRDGAADFPDHIRRAALDLLGHDRAAGIVASEIAVLYYGLGAWRARPHVPAGASAFTHHRRSGYAAIVVALLLMIAAEGIAVHLLLSMWSPAAAWLLTIGSAYTALWLVADLRATALRPILVDETGIVFRAGLRWSVRVPRERIAAIVREKPDLGKESLRLTALAAPTHWVVLAEPATADGPYGLRRRVRAIGVQPDDPEAFERAVGLQPVSSPAEASPRRFLH